MRYEGDATSRKTGTPQASSLPAPGCTVMTLANRINEKDVKQIPFYLKANK